MASHNNTELLQRVLGSGAQVVTRHAPVPVLVLRQRTPTHGSFACDDHPLRMLVLLDGSVLAEAVLKPAAHLLATFATPGQAAMHLLQVVKRATSPDMTEDVYPLQQAQAYLASIADTLQKSVVAERKPVITWAAIRDTDIAHAIIETAEGGVGLKGAGTSAGYDLIAMATHGRLGLQFLERGSVAERLLAGTNLPVFIVRAEPITNERATVREAGERRCDQVFG